MPQKWDPAKRTKRARKATRKAPCWDEIVKVAPRINPSVQLIQNPIYISSNMLGCYEFRRGFSSMKQSFQESGGHFQEYSYANRTVRETAWC